MEEGSESEAKPRTERYFAVESYSKRGILQLVPELIDDCRWLSTAVVVDSEIGCDGNFGLKIDSNNVGNTSVWRSEVQTF